METIKRIDESSVEIDGKVYDVRKEKTLQGETTFKVGDWVIGKDGFDPEYPIRIEEKTEEGHRWHDIRSGRQDGNADKYVRPATPAEIESHLRKICDEKYVGKRVKSLVDKRFVGLFIDRAEYWDTRHDEIKDGQVWYRAGKCWLLVYDNGKWAEVLPDKKPIPKTREEFRALHKEWDTTPLTYEQVLDQYDFE